MSRNICYVPIVYLDVGDTPPEEVRDVIDAAKKSGEYDPLIRAGAVFIPIRGGNTRVETLRVSRTD